jgi:head-tail adaptor
MIFGKLDTRLTLYKQTFTSNSYGERVVSAQSIAYIYADFDYKSGGTKYEADFLENTEVIQAMIRYRTNIGASNEYLLQNGSNYYSIKSVREIGRKDYMMLTLELKDVADINIFNNIYSLDFDGVDDQLLTNANGTLADTTYTFWAKASAGGGGKGVLGHGSNTTAAFNLTWGGGTNALLFMASNVNRQWDLTGVVDGTWKHYALVLDASDITECKLYINGSEATVSSTTANDTFNTWSTGLRMGTDTGTRFLPGNLDEFAWFDTKLTSTQIASVYNSGTVKNLINEDNIKGYWRMGDGSSFPIIIDQIGSNDATMTNMSANDIVTNTP